MATPWAFTRDTLHIAEKETENTKYRLDESSRRSGQSVRHTPT